jgi:hypothetical protein
MNNFVSQLAPPHVLNVTVPPGERQKGSRLSPALEPTELGLPTVEPLAEPLQMFADD